MRSVLAALLPEPDETALLQACLLDGSGAGDGWRRWRSARVGSGRDLCADLARRRTLMPLLASSVARNGIDVDAEVQVYIRAASLREERRTARFHEIAALALDALATAGVPVLVLRGAALSVTVYKHPAHRHCHDLDVLVAPEALGQASTALEAHFGRLIASTEVGDVRIEHSSGMCVSLHTRPFTVAHYRADSLDFWRESRVAAIDGVEIRIASPADSFVHVLGHATCNASARNLHWVADAWHLAARYAELDWEEVSAGIAVHRLQLPVSVLLDFLDAFGLHVPAHILARVRSRAGRTDYLAREIALGGVLAAAQGNVGRVWRSATTWSDRLQLLKWAAFPTPQYVRATFAPNRSWRLPLLYLYRPARFVAERFGRTGMTATPIRASTQAHEG